MEKERGPKMEGRSVGGRGRTKARERGESWKGGGERHRWKGTRLVEEAAGIGRLSARGRGFKRNQFRVAVQSNVTPAAAGVNVGRNSNFTPGPR